MNRLSVWLLRSRTLALPVLLLVALWLPGVGHGAYRVDAGRYAAIAHWAYARAPAGLLDLRLGEEPYFNKPPIAFWIHGAFLNVLGTDLWAARLPGLLAAVLCAGLTVRAARACAGEKAALFSGLALVTTHEFFRASRSISLDLWQTVFLCGALWCAARAARTDRPAPLLHAGVFVGLALLTKPLMALLSPPIFAVWVITIGRARWLGHVAASVGIAVAVALPWHVWMAAQHPGANGFAARYFGHETIERAAGTVGNPSGEWWYYLRLLAVTWWPWVLAAIAGLVMAFSRRAGVGNRESGVGGAEEPELSRDDPARAHRRDACATDPVQHGRGARCTEPTESRRRLLLLCAIWFMAWLVVLTAFPDRGARYAMALWPAGAILAGIAIARMKPPGAKVRRIARAVTLWIGPAALAISIVLAALDVRVHRGESDHWRELWMFLDGDSQAVRAPLWVVDSMGADGCLIYLHTGRWPRVWDSRGGGPAPSPGDLVLVNEEDNGPVPRPSHAVFKSDRLVVMQMGDEPSGQ